MSAVALAKEGQLEERLSDACRVLRSLGVAGLLRCQVDRKRLNDEREQTTISEFFYFLRSPPFSVRFGIPKGLPVKL
jgi:hypothetical protein